VRAGSILGVGGAVDATDGTVLIVPYLGATISGADTTGEISDAETSGTISRELVGATIRR
jgi:hypothetical protein